MDIQMTAQVDGRGKLTMEALAQAWDALNDRDVPPDAEVHVSASLTTTGNRWVIVARWTPADPEPDEADAEAAERIPLDAFGLPPRKTMAERLAENVEAVQDELARPLFQRYYAPGLDPQSTAEAVRRRHRGQGYLNP